jgi:hypothetical protein
MMMQQGRGAMPVGIEPLHAWEKQGFSTLADPRLAGGGGMVDAQAKLRQFMGSQQTINPVATDYMNRVGQMFGKADSATAAGIAPINESDISRFSNPFTKQVTQVGLDQLSEDARELRRQLSFEQGATGAASFGRASDGIRQSGLDRSELMGRSSLAAEYGYKGWQDAIGNLFKEKDNSLQGAGIYAGLGNGYSNAAATAQDITNSGTTNALAPIRELFGFGQKQTDQTLENARNQIRSGGAVRGFNQNLADISLQDYQAEQNYPRTNLTNTLSLLPSFQNNRGAVAEGAPTQSGIGQFGDALNVAGQIGGFGAEQGWFK